MTTSSDGDFSKREIVAPTARRLPFLNWPTKDAATTLFSRLYEIDRASYVPFGTLATLPDDGPDDGADANAFLLVEGDAEYMEDGTQRWRCQFGHIPPTQTRVIERFITKPSPSAFANFSALVLVDGGVAVDTACVAYGGAFWGNNKVYPYKVVTSANSGGNTRVTCTAHGITGTEDILINYNISVSWIRYSAGEYTVVDLNTIDILGVNYGTNTSHLGRYLRDYTPGLALVRLRETWNFYLPGAPGQPATEDDIPTISTAVNDAYLLSLVLAHATGYFPYDAEPLDTDWPAADSSIYRRRSREIDIASL